MRYSRLLDYVRAYQPKAILEVGTWNGQTAHAMLKIVPDAKYYGFDLFEDASAVTDAEEKNVKPHYTMRYVKAFLDGFDVELHKGNTRETLAAFDKPVDFVWLDGGHSVETIRSDWENVKRVVKADACILFDDYYTGPIDTSQFGCNEVVKNLRHQIIPIADPVAGGGFVQMVRVWAS